LRYLLKKLHCKLFLSQIIIWFHNNSKDSPRFKWPERWVFLYSLDLLSCWFFDENVWRGFLFIWFVIMMFKESVSITFFITIHFSSFCLFHIFLIECSINTTFSTLYLFFLFRSWFFSFWDALVITVWFFMLLLFNYISSILHV